MTWRECHFEYGYLTRNQFQQSRRRRRIGSEINVEMNVVAELSQPRIRDGRVEVMGHQGMTVVVYGYATIGQYENHSVSCCDLTYGRCAMHLHEDFGGPIPLHPKSR